MLGGRGSGTTVHFFPENPHLILLSVKMGYKTWHMSRIQAHLIFSIQIFFKYMCTTTQYVVNIMTLKKINILEYPLGRGEGVIKKSTLCMLS